MIPFFIIEMKSSGSYFMSSIKDGTCGIHQKYRPFIEVIKYSPSDYISTSKGHTVVISHVKLVYNMHVHQCIF